MYTFWEIIASNAVVATVLAVVAALLSRVWKNAAALHVLWIVVLLKLFTPPLVIAELPVALTSLAPEASADSDEKALTAPVHEAQKFAAVTKSRGAIAAGNQQRMFLTWFAETAGRDVRSFSTILAAMWICSAGVTALVYAVRIRRFASVVRDSEPAPAAIRAMVSQLSSRLGLSRVPDVMLMSRALPPLVWSVGGRPRVILPSELFARLSSDAQSTILAHELFHIRRGDHHVRLLELAATTVFWWHPVVWWASWQLRELEERCCDGRVLELLPHHPRTYAAALVDTLEFLSEQPRIRFPLHTTIYSAGSLSIRIRMLAQHQTSRLSALSATLVAALVIFPLVAAFAVQSKQTSKNGPQAQQSAGASSAILRGRVTDEAGAPLADVRVRVVAIVDPDKRVVEARTDLGTLEVRSDVKGDYRLEIPRIEKRRTIMIDATKPGYRSLRGPTMSRGDLDRFDVVPGTPAEAPLILKAGIYFAGIVVDEQGKPIPGVIVDAYAHVRGATFNIEKTMSNSNGSFELFAYPVTPLVHRGAVTKGVVYFVHPDYIDRDSEDVYALQQKKRQALRIVLGTGYKLAGTVLDLAGKPVPKAMIKAVRKDKTHRKATLTDANGKFALRGLSEGLNMLTARALDIRQQTYLPMALKSDQNDLEIRLKPIEWPDDLKRHAVLGMQLADVTAELKSTYDLFGDRGALILDPGKDSDRLKIGQLAEGYTFWMVGRTRIGSVSEFVSQILVETAGQNADEYSVRVVYNFSRVDMDGARTATLRFTKDDLKQLQSVSDQFTP